MDELIASLFGQLPSVFDITPRMFEIIASALSCFGAHIVSRHGHAGKALIGWQAWVCAGVLWISFAIISQHWFMAITQTYFMYTAIQGRKNTMDNMVANREVM